MKKKIYFITSHPIQYQVPIFQEIYQKNKNFHVVFEKKFGKKLILFDKEFNKKIKWGSSLIKKYKFYIYKNKQSFFSNICDYFIFLKRNKIDLMIISGWNSFFFIITIFFAKILNIKIALRCENNFFNCNFVSRQVKKFFLFFFFKLFYKFYAIGLKNYKMYSQSGVNKSKIVLTRYCVDEKFFNVSKLNIQKLIKFKKKYFKKRKKTYLFVGKIIERKGYSMIIQLAKKIIQEKSLANLSQIIIIGSGPEISVLKNQIKKNNLTNIRFINFFSQENLKYFYYLSDYLLLPSYYETWGLVANESMSMGTPCIVSDKCGCANDLVINNKNGYVFKSRNLVSLFNTYKKSLNNKNYKHFKLQARKHLKNYSLEKAVKILNS